MKGDISIIVCGDICPVKDTFHFFEVGNAQGLLNQVADHIKDADISFANLECVLSDTGQPIEKIGPVLNAPEKYAALYSKAGFDVLGIANNHIGDCGGQGVMDTISACKKEGLQLTGAGKNIENARVPIIIKKNGWRIGFFAVAEEEFNAASDDSPGANIFDPYTSFNHLKDVKSKCDFLVVLYHGGIEHYQYPSPLLQKKCRALVTHGADIVLCQHSHCVGASENYKGKEILYGQGNTSFGYRPGNSTWNEGLIVKINLSLKEQMQTVVDYLPIICTKDGAINIAEGDEAGSLLKAMQNRSESVQTKEQIEQKWRTYCHSKSFTHIPHLLGFSKNLTRVNRLFHGAIFNRFFTKKQKRITMNVIRCDAHREVIQTSLKQIVTKLD